MKRSEVLKELEDILYASENIEDPAGLSDYSALAEEVLKELEKLGMVPPVIMEKSWKIDEDTGEMIYAVHSWESE